MAGNRTLFQTMSPNGRPRENGASKVFAVIILELVPAEGIEPSQER
jgi:hypothetical protein